MIPIYVLNLARSPERRAFMVDICSGAGVAPEFVAAVDGRACRATVTPRAALSRAETALILSHRKAWRRLLRGDAPFAVVLEDDAHLGAGFAELVAGDWAGLIFDTIKLDTLFYSALVARRGVAYQGRSLHAMRGEHVGAAGYVVSRAGARKLLRLTRRLTEPVDHSIFGRRAIRRQEIRAYQLLPAAVAQDNMLPAASSRRGLVTTLHDADRAALAMAARKAKPRVAERLRREAGRFLAQIADVARAVTTCRKVRPDWT